jgi:hypothetical protein
MHGLPFRPAAIMSVPPKSAMPVDVPLMSNDPVVVPTWNVADTARQHSVPPVEHATRLAPGVKIPVSESPSQV